MDATTTGTIFAQLPTDVGSALSANLPAIVGILAALIALGLLIRYFKRWVGRK